MNMLKRLVSLFDKKNKQSASDNTSEDDKGDAKITYDYKKFLNNEARELWMVSEKACEYLDSVRSSEVLSGHVVCAQIPQYNKIKSLGQSIKKQYGTSALSTSLVFVNGMSSTVDMGYKHDAVDIIKQVWSIENIL
jgi:hypothetical protein